MSCKSNLITYKSINRRNISDTRFAKHIVFQSGIYFLSVYNYRYIPQSSSFWHTYHQPLILTRNQFKFCFSQIHFYIFRNHTKVSSGYRKFSINITFHRRNFSNCHYRILIGQVNHLFLIFITGYY